MANPTSLKSYRWPIVFAAGPTQFDVELEVDRSYTVAHDNEDEDGVNNANTVYFSFDGVVSANPQSGYNKLKLTSGRVAEIGPGLKKMSFRTISGYPTFTVIPSSLYYGMH